MAIVYLHKRKDNNNVFYIGIGKTEARAFDLLPKRRNIHWQRVAEKYGVYVEVIHKDISWNNACEIEKALIIYYRALYGSKNITNIVDGGQGSNGLIISAEAKQKMREKKLGVKQPDHVKLKRAESLRKTLQNPEVRAKYAAASTGRNHTEETKEKMSNRAKGGGNNSAKKVIDNVTGQIFDCMKDAAASIGMPVGTLQHQLSGYCKNKTNFHYL